ncbi:hypothetical protein Pelo_8687 [Pelomyxa schiedti]|nr:hypothetical protein Pelo_8687 [Pelomyxa schiedti]
MRPSGSTTTPMASGDRLATEGGAGWRRPVAAGCLCLCLCACCLGCVWLWRSASSWGPLDDPAWLRLASAAQSSSRAAVAVARSVASFSPAAAAAGGQSRSRPREATLASLVQGRKTRTVDGDSEQDEDCVDDDNGEGGDTGGAGASQGGGADSTETQPDCYPGVKLWSVQNRYSCSGAYCYVDQMVCNGSLVSRDTSTTARFLFSDSCEVLSLICNQLHVNLSEQHQVNNCTILRFSNRRGSLATNPVQIQCSDHTSFGYQSYGFKCSEQQVFCNNSLVSVSGTTQINNTGCEIKEVTCDSPWTTCETLQLECDPNVCTASVTSSVPCSNYCYQNVNITWCTCPEDYQGSICETQSPFSCSLEVLSPSNCSLVQPTVSESDSVLNGDHTCLVVEDLDEVIEFQLKLNCSYRYTPSTPSYDFNYWLVGPQFKISLNTTWSLHQIFYDFVSFSRPSFLTVNLTQGQMIGSENITIVTSMSSVPGDVWVGGRLYQEFAFETLAPPGYQSTSMTHHVIDRTDITYPPTHGITTRALIIAIVVPIAVVIVLSVIGFIVLWRFYLSPHAKQN